MCFIAGTIGIIVILFILLILYITSRDSKKEHFDYVPLLIMTKTGGIAGINKTVEIYEDQSYIVLNASRTAIKKGNIDGATWQDIQFLINNPLRKQKCQQYVGSDFFSYYLAIGNFNFEFDDGEIMAGCVPKKISDAVNNISSLFVGT